MANNFKYAKPGPYQTQLMPDEERKFQAWVKANNIPWHESPQSDYDMRGYWKAQQGGDPLAQRAANLHFPDKWKTPYHETFSNESQYALPSAPHWEGDKLVPTPAQNGTKLVKVNGKTYRVPADATPEEIDQISSANAAADRDKNWNPSEHSIKENDEHLIRIGQMHHAEGHPMPGSFEGHSENIGEWPVASFGREGIGGGLYDIAHGDIAKGGHETISGVGNALLPVAPFAAAAAPIRFALGTGVGYGVGKGAEKTASALGANEEQSQFAGDIGNLVGGYFGAGAPGAWPYIRRPLGKLITTTGDITDAVTHPARTLRNWGERLAEPQSPQIELFRNAPKVGNSPTVNRFEAPRAADNPTFDFNKPKAPPPRDFAASHEIVGREPELLPPVRTRGTMLESGEGPKLLPEGPIQLGEPTEIQSPSVFPARKIITRDPSSGRMKTMYGSDSGPTLYQPGAPKTAEPTFNAPARPVNKTFDLDQKLEDIHGLMDEKGFPKLEGPESGAPSFKDYGTNSPSTSFPPRRTLFGSTPSRPAVNNTPFSQRPPNSTSFDLEQQLRQSVDATGDTEAWNQAKREIPNGTFSQWAQRAQEIKSGKL